MLLSYTLYVYVHCSTDFASKTFQLSLFILNHKWIVGTERLTWIFCAIKVKHQNGIAWKWNWVKYFSFFDRFISSEALISRDSNATIALHCERMNERTLSGIKSIDLHYNNTSTVKKWDVKSNMVSSNHS